MILIPRKLGFACAILVTILVFVATLAFHRHAQRQWRDRSEILRRQREELARWGAANIGLSNTVAQARSATALSETQLRELLRLRNEVGQLLRQAEPAQQLREENRMLQALSALEPATPGASAADPDETALSAETLQTGRRIALALPGALQRFADEHNSAMPADFSELRRYFPTNGERVPGMFLFEFVRENGPVAGDTLILRESADRDSGGKQRRAYIFSTGHVLEAVSENGDFGTWERQHGIPPPAADR